jgi:hypothetical protein
LDRPRPPSPAEGPVGQGAYVSIHFPGNAAEVRRVIGQVNARDGLGLARADENKVSTCPRLNETGPCFSELTPRS